MWEWCGRIRWNALQNQWNVINLIYWYRFIETSNQWDRTLLPSRLKYMKANKNYQIWQEMIKRRKSNILFEMFCFFADCCHATSKRKKKKPSKHFEAPVTTPGKPCGTIIRQYLRGCFLLILRHLRDSSKIGRKRNVEDLIKLGSFFIIFIDLE